jgi:PKD repeat protein
MKNLLLCLLWFTVNTLSFTAFSQQQYAVHFQHGTEIFPLNINDLVPLKALPEEIVNNKFVRYVQFTSVLKSTQRESLQNAGIQVVGYVNFGAYLLAIPENYNFQELESYGARSIVKPVSSWKMHKNLKERPWGEWAVQGNQIDVVVQIYPFLTIPEGAEMCRKEGFTILETGNQNGYVLVRMNQDELDNAAALPFIQWMEIKPAPGIKEDINGRSLHRANLLDSDHPLGNKFNGEGVNTLVRDDGAVGPHIDFQGRLYNQSGVDGPTNGTHGDGVAGIIGGTGNLDPTKKGMAAGADIYVVDYANHFQDQTLPLFLDQNVTITNSSYSDGCNQGYTLASQTVDNQIYENPNLIHVFSAGNSNNLECGYGAGDQWGNITGGHKMAKNAIATANLRVDAALESTSSRGPAYDGRTKPDISAHGAEQNSNSTGNTYQVFGGTSAAAPGIAGCLAQLTQAYRTINNTNDAPTALLKAALLNTANELGNAGPDFKFGWGQVNNYKALQLLEQGRYLFSQIDQGGSNTHTVAIPAGIKEAKLMIYWVDPEAQSNAAMALLNDLDLIVKSPDGASHLPWKLDPTPDADILNMPAGVGRDSLNNMEQVALENPAPGNYVVTIDGYGVPFGPQQYYLVWEFLTDDVKITYPSGGEGLVSGSSVWLRWDALGNTEPFTLKYSANGGATYSTVAELSNSARMYNWQVPGAITGNAKMVLVRGSQSDTTQFPFSVSPLPTGLVVQQSCPESITLGWNKVNSDTVAYDAYLLGEKYMELQGSSLPNQSSYTFPITDPEQEKWFSLRTSSLSGLMGRRTIAINWPGGLLGCSQANDLAMVKFTSPSDGALFGCGGFQKPVSVLVKNEGLTASSGAKIWYQYQNQPVIQEDLPDIPAGESLEFVFATPINFSTSGQITISTGILFPSDNYQPNNQKIEKFEVVVQSTTSVFNNTFETTNLPAGWANVNLDAAVGWSRFNTPVTGSNGGDTRAYWVDHFTYMPAANQEDYLYLIPIELTNIAYPVLLFDYAHAKRNGNTIETLRVEAFPNCDLSAAPIVLWEKSDPQLSSIETTVQYFPSDLAQWRKVALPLDQFAGQTVVLRFTAVNDFGNSTFIDNIALKNLQTIPPVATFSVADSVCRAVPVSFVAIPSPGSENVYNWIFGSLASPADAYGPGPHVVTYPIPGNKSVRLVVDNPFGSDTITKVINVRSNPVSNFTQILDGLTATFNNISTSATNYLWDFGDGNTSTVKNPVHTYAVAGTYTVKLSAINPCKTTDKMVAISLTSGTVEQTGLTSIAVLPNPNKGVFQVEFNSLLATNAQVTLSDVAGKLIGSKSVVINAGTTIIAFEYNGIASGNYQLAVQTPKGIVALSVVIVH